MVRVIHVNDIPNGHHYVDNDLDGWDFSDPDSPQPKRSNRSSKKKVEPPKPKSVDSLSIGACYDLDKLPF